MSVLFVQVDRVEDLIHMTGDYFTQPKQKPKPITQADRIRAMSDEELAEWLCDIAGWLPMYEGKMHPILDWLRQEAET